MSAISPQSTLVALVLCSRDHTRGELGKKVLQNLARLVPDAGLTESLLVFDNGSTFRDHEDIMPEYAVFCRSERNLGYWTALKWILDNRRNLFQREFNYIYIVESDHFDCDLRPLALCERFLDVESKASCVRTQKFVISPMQRWRYNKACLFLPFSDPINAVQMFNAVTKEKAWFQPVVGFQPIYLSNLHGKLPTLSRLSVLDRAFAELAKMPSFTEWELFRLMMEEHPYIGMYDGGLFSGAVSSKRRRSIVSGSYTDPKDLARMGYTTTRTAHIESGPHEVEIRRRMS